MKRTLSWLLVGCIASCGEFGSNGNNGTNGTDGQDGKQGPQGPAGPQGPPGKDGANGIVEGSISSLSPVSIPGGRSATLEIAGVGSHFRSGYTTVSFDDNNISVSQLDVGSTTNLRVYVDVLPQAALGAHRVTVTTVGALTGGATETLALQNGLTIAKTLIAELPVGSSVPASGPQGGLTTVLYRNLDYRDNPFDVKTVQPTSGAVNLVGLTVAPPSKIDETTYNTMVLIDALAPLGRMVLGLSSDTPIHQLVKYVSDPLDSLAPQVTAGILVGITANNTLVNQTISAPNRTLLYKLAKPVIAPDNVVAMLRLSNLKAGLLPGINGLPRVIGYQAPGTGRFAEGVPFDTSQTVIGSTLSGRNVALYLPKGDDYYFALYTNNLSGSSTHSFDLLLKSRTGTNLSLAEPAQPDTPAKPIRKVSLTNLSYYATDGRIDVINASPPNNVDADYLQFDVTGTGRVYASASNKNGLPIGVALYLSDCVTPIDMQSGLPTTLPTGAASQEAAVTAPVGGTATYCLQITGPTPTPYQLVLTQDIP